ncbi:hypothetical protein D3C75_968420 [compost metagenome]
MFVAAEFTYSSWVVARVFTSSVCAASVPASKPPAPTAITLPAAVPTFANAAEPVLAVVNTSIHADQVTFKRRSNTLPVVTVRYVWVTRFDATTAPLTNKNPDSTTGRFVEDELIYVIPVVNSVFKSTTFGPGRSLAPIPNAPTAMTLPEAVPTVAVAAVPNPKAVRCKACVVAAKNDLACDGKSV